MSACVPVRDMKDTATFTALVESERDVTVTKNGYEAMHCISSDQYRLMQEEGKTAVSYDVGRRRNIARRLQRLRILRGFDTRQI